MGARRSGGAPSETSILEREELVFLRSIQFQIGRRTPKQLGGQNDQISPELALDAPSDGADGTSNSNAGATGTMARANGNGSTV